MEFRNDFRKSSLTLFRRLPLTDWLGELELEKGGKGGEGRGIHQERGRWRNQKLHTTIISAWELIKVHARSMASP